MDSRTKSKVLSIISILLILVIVLVSTYALTTSSYNVDITTAYVNIDEDAYGETNFDSSKLTFRPIIDTPSNVGNEDEVIELLDEAAEDNNIIKIDFKVGGASTNNNDSIIYDIALNNLVVDCALLSPYIKWKLIKNPDSGDREIFNGSLDYKTFDTIKDGRLVLTTIQQDLVDYNADKTVYDDYVFYMWFSDSCQGSLIECVNNDIDEQVDLFGKSLEGKIEVELYTEGKKEITRTPSDELDTSTCSQNYIVTFNVNGGDAWNDTTCISPSILNDGTCTKSVRYNETYGDLPTPTKENSIFDGWYESASSPNKITSSTKVSRLASHEVYARWRVYKVNIKYNVNGGTITGTTRSPSGNETYTWTKSSSGIISRSINGAIGTNIIQTIDHGVTLTSDGLYNPDDANYMNITKTYYHPKEGEEWICLSGDCTVGTTYSDSYIYSSNDFCDASTSDCTVELGVNWERNDGVYYAYYDGVDSLDGQYAIIFPGQAYGTLPEPSVANFNFLGWYLEDTYETEVTSSTVVDSNLSSDITIYAKLESVKVTIGLEQPDGSTSNIYLKLGEGYYSNSDCTTSITKITVPSRTGYTFNGYSGLTDASGNITASNTAYTTNTTLSPSWTANQYTINYYLETTKVGSSTCTYNASCTLSTFEDDLGQTFPYSSTTDTNYGWEFEGWSTSQTSTDRSYTDSYEFTSFNLSSNINLYAVGKRTLRFHSGVAPTTTISTPIQYWNTYSTSNTNLTAVDVPAATIISGWSFIGYKGGSNTASATVDISTTGSQVVPYNVYPNIRSKYQRTLTLEYNANGGTGTTTSSTTTQYYNSGYASTSGLTNQGANVSTHSFTLSSNGFTRSGYTFSKWADGSASGTQYAVGASISFSPAVGTTTTTKTMYAVWTANLQSVTLASGPTKTTYYSDEDVSYTGITLKRTYTDGSTNTIDGTSYVTGYTTNTDNSNNVRYTITVKYGSFSALSVTTYKKGWYCTKYEYCYYYNLSTGARVTGEANIPIWNDSTITHDFYFDSNGKMFTGWRQKSSGVWYYYLEGSNNTIGVTSYVTNTDWVKHIKNNFERGAALKLVWAQIYDSSRGLYFWYHFDSTGIMQMGWFQDADGKWYYLRPDNDWCTSGPQGSMVASATCPIGNTNYTFNSSGVCTSSGC